MADQHGVTLVPVGEILDQPWEYAVPLNPNVTTTRQYIAVTVDVLVRYEETLADHNLVRAIGPVAMMIGTAPDGVRWVVVRGPVRRAVPTHPN